MEPKESLPLLTFVRRPSKAVCPASAAVKRVCRERASKRWSALLTQSKSRIGFKCGMRKRLGEANWATFVKYAEEEYKVDFFRAFTPVSGTICCSGKLNGSPYPKELSINMKSLSSVECGKELEKLHLDHTENIERTCKVWSQALPAEPKCWDDGVCGPLVAHLLFGTQDHVVAQCSDRPIWRKQLFFRCGNVKEGEDQRGADFCHVSHQSTLQVGDIAWSP